MAVCRTCHREGRIREGDKKKGEMKAELHIKFVVIIFVQKLEKKY
jgi:hypothetical protein